MHHHFFCFCSNLVTTCYSNKSDKRDLVIHLQVSCQVMSVMKISGKLCQ